MPDQGCYALEDLLDRAQINALHDHYLAALDNRDADAYTACFTLDGELTVLGRLHRGHEQIRMVLADMDAVLEEVRTAQGDDMPLPVMRHITTNHAITLSGAHACHRANWMTIMSGPDKQVTIPTIGHYKDELVKRDGIWLFSRRVVVQDIPVL